MSVAKGLGGGYMPLSATIYQERIGRTLDKAHGGQIGGHTFTAHTTACAAALKVQQIVQEEKLLDRVRKKGQWLGAELQSRLGTHPNVGNVRGRGYFWGIELVEDKETKRPFDPDLQMAERLGRALSDENLLLYPVKSFVDDTHGDGAIVAPAYNATDEELEEIVGRTEKALKKLFGG